MSKSLLPLTEEDVEFFTYVTLGKLDDVLNSPLFQQLTTTYRFKLNEQGYTVWHVAVQRRDLAMLELLLPFAHEDIFYDLLLHAIQGGNLSIVQKIVQHTDEKVPHIKPKSYLDRWKYSQYPSDVTPIMLSATVGNYSLIKYFYNSGEVFYPEKTRLSGTKRRIDDREDQENYARLRAFQARSSPEMLCYRTNTEASFDPIREALEIIDLLKHVKRQEHEIIDEYEAVQSRLKQFLTELLDQCKSTEDMKLLLKQKEGYPGRNDEYPRLMLALESKCREFVIHPHCQKILYMQWAGEKWPDWKSRGSVWKASRILARLLTLPLICIWLYFDFCSEKANFYRTPVNRCINDFVAYIYFLGLLTVEAYLYTLNWVADLHDTPCKVVEGLIILFVGGHALRLTMQFLIAPKSFLKVRWNWYELITNLSFAGTFYFWVTIWHDEYVEPTPPGFRRLDWRYDDPVLCGQACFSVSIILAYGRFMRFFQMNYTLGPMQITLANLVEDISVFIFFFLVIVFTFANTIYFLYSPLIKEEDLPTSDYGHHSNTVYVVFWATLALANPERFDQPGSHICETVGKVVWMVYHLLGTCMLMNMLTGYMGNTFSRIAGNVVAVWKWNRTSVWVYYTRHTVMPPPFNLIPSFHSICNCYKWILNSGQSGKKVMTCSQQACCYLEERETATMRQNRIIRYNNMMRELVQRYLRSKLVVDKLPHATGRNVHVVADQVNKLKRTLLQTLRSRPDGSVASLLSVLSPTASRERQTTQQKL